MWLSLVEHRVRDAGVAGSNPATPTIFASRLPIGAARAVASAGGARYLTAFPREALIWRGGHWGMV